MLIFDQDKKPNERIRIIIRNKTFDKGEFLQMKNGRCQQESIKGAKGGKKMTGNEITIRKRFTGVLTALAVFLAMTIQIMPAMAKTPEKESVKYEGGGRVEVEFYGDVEWKNTKVKVKDTSGKRYKTTIIKYDDDEIEFVFLNLDNDD